MCTGAGGVLLPGGRVVQSGAFGPLTPCSQLCVWENLLENTHPNANLLLRLDRTKLDRASLSPSYIMVNASDCTQLTNSLYGHGSMIQLRQRAQRLRYIQAVR